MGCWTLEHLKEAVELAERVTVGPMVSQMKQQNNNNDGHGEKQTKKEKKNNNEQTGEEEEEEQEQEDESSASEEQVVQKITQRPTPPGKLSVIFLCQICVLHKGRHLQRLYH